MKFEDLRSLFPIVEKKLYFDAASLSPYCTTVMDKLEKFRQVRSESGSLLFDKWYTEIDESRSLAGSFMGASPDEIAYMKNTSEGINLTAQIIDWNKGDEVLLMEDDFPTNTYPFLNLKNRGVHAKFAGLCNGGSGSVTEKIRNAVSEKTRLLSISHVFYNSGYRVDLKEIGEICQDNDLLFHVDAAQSLGAFKIDVKKSNIDFLSACGFKWLLSPLGTGIYYIRKELIDCIPPVVGWLSVREPKKLDTKDYRLLDSAKRFEAGSLNIGGFLGMVSAMKLIKQVGLNRVEKRILSLATRLSDALEEAGFDLDKGRDEKNRSGIVCSEKKEVTADSLVKKNIIATVRKNLRFSPHIYNNEEDVDRLGNILSNL